MRVRNTWSNDPSTPHTRSVEWDDGRRRVDVGEAAGVTIAEAGATWERLDRILASVEANERLIADSRRKRKRWESVLRRTRRVLDR